MTAIATLDTADPEALARFDMVIDVRSPAEFAEDHAPGAVNLPVLDDAERAEVGTIYVQSSKFDARRLGASYVARNVGDHLAGPLSDKGGGFQPLLYCWRGGMRSNAMAVVLAEVGWRVTVLKGGYKTYRARVSGQPLQCAAGLRGGPARRAPPARPRTEILRRAAARSACRPPTLEGTWADDRGLLLGGLPGRPQPDQKLFETPPARGARGVRSRRARFLVEA